jgi:hypothetical protein
MCSGVIFEQSSGGKSKGFEWHLTIPGFSESWEPYPKDTPVYGIMHPANNALP